LGVDTTVSAVFYDDSAWLCIGSLCPRICRQPPGSISACAHDDLGVANANVTWKATDYACPQNFAAPSATSAESTNHGPYPGCAQCVLLIEQF
jgi:hypothetical protein